MRRRPFAKIGKRLSAFVGGQSAVQLLNAATGLALLRLLPKPEFAIYAIALGVQGMITILTDVGFGSAILALVGTRFDDKKLLGSYIRAASSIRRYLMMIVSVIAIVVIVSFRHSRFEAHGTREVTFLAVAILVTLQFQAWASYYESPLLLHNRMVALYAPQISGATLRMACVFVLYYTNTISSTSVVVANTLSIVIMGVCYRIMARRYIEVPRALPREHAGEMIKYLTPMLPLYLYAALSGQISLFLIAVFGHVGQIADVAAVGRIGQLFLLLNSSNTVLVTPLFAKTPRALFSKRYAYAMGVVGIVSLLVSASARLFPGLYLFLLGAKYSGLTIQVQLVVYSSSITYFSGAMGAVALARKWIFWWSGTLQVVVVGLAQLVSAMLLPLNTSEGVLMMNIYTAIAALGVQIVFLIQGLSRHTKAEAEQVAAS
jgi:O-antigen/teichoic acid export membrane protein